MLIGLGATHVLGYASNVVPVLVLVVTVFISKLKASSKFVFARIKKLVSIFAEHK